MRQLVRFGTARQVYRPGELIFPNRPGAPPRVPVGWNFGLKVGTDGALAAGFRSVPSLIIGQINPRTFMGYTIDMFYCASNTNMLRLSPGVQIPGINSVTVTAEGYAGSVSLVWVGAQLRYQFSLAAFANFLRANVGKVIGVTLVGSAVFFSAPYPWEPFTTHATLNDWVEELDLEVPPDWFALTIAAKKAWLAETYGDG